MFKKVKIAPKIKLLIYSILVFSTIAFVERKNDETTCGNIKIKIEDTEGNYFLDDKALKELLTVRGQHPVIGEKLIHIELKTLEKRLKLNKFVKNVQVSKNLKGTLSISVKQHRPIARFLRADTSFYLGSEGDALPLSNRYTARVALVSGEGIKKYYNNDSIRNENESSLYDVLKYIYEDDFLRAQVAGIEVDKNGELVLQPQVTGQLIYFGTCEQHVNKFKKLRVFYDKILPEKGWNGYKSVNLKYKDQIICK